MRYSNTCRNPKFGALRHENPIDFIHKMQCVSGKTQLDRYFVSPPFKLVTLPPKEDWVHELHGANEFATRA